MSALKPHEFDPVTDFCRHCGVPKYAVVDEIAPATCSQPVPLSLNHGGPGICSHCYPHLAGNIAKAVIRTLAKSGKSSPPPPQAELPL